MERPERLSPISAIFLDSYEHFGLLTLVEPGPGGPPDLEAIRARIAARLGRSPQLRRRLVPTPLGLAPPIWSDDPDFSVANHVDARHGGPPHGGPPLDGPGLRAAVKNAFGRRLTLERPPWGLTLLGSLEDGRQALLLRVHHALASGMTAGILFVPVLFDIDPDEPAGTADPWQPRPLPGTGRLAAWAIGDRLHRLASLRPGHPNGHRPHTRSLRAELRDARRAYREELAERAPASSLNGPLSDRRAYAFVSHTLDDIKAAQAAVGGHASVNDVVLATLAGGMRTWLAAGGHATNGLRAQIPVSLVEGGRARFGTSTSFMIVDLPLDEPDPLHRVTRVSAETAFRKAAGADAIRALMALAFRLPPRLRAPILHRVTSERVQNLIVSDIPGPPAQLYFHGGAVTDAYPILMLSPRHRVRISAASLGGRLTFGITADPAELGDPQALADAIEAALGELADRR